VGWLARLLLRRGARQEFVDAILLEIPEDAPGHANLNADAHTVVHSIAAVVLLFVCIGATAAADALFGSVAATVTGTLLVMPPVFFLSLMVVVQVAKFRRRFSGIQPVLGRLSWAFCVTVVALTAVAFAISSRKAM
jgi:hypothetical protein